MFVFWRQSSVFGSSFAKIAVTLYLGGAVGNLIDRVRFGSVTDFLDFSIYPWAFNVADAAMTTAVIMFIYSLLFLSKNTEKAKNN